MDLVIRATLALAFAGVALVCGVLALVRWRERRRLPWLTVAGAAVSLALAVALEVSMPPEYSRDEQHRIERLHAQFAPVLERYRQAHGEYPPTLQAAGIATPATRYGPLQYTPRRATDGTPAYSIAFGDYFRNGFSAWWESESGKWHLADQE